MERSNVLMISFKFLDNIILLACYIFSILTKLNKKTKRPRINEALFVSIDRHTRIARNE